MPGVWPILAYLPGDVSRVRPAAIVRDWIVSCFSVAPMEVGGSRPFNVGHAKNRGVELTPQAAPGDVFLLCDADCVAPVSQAREAVWKAAEAPGIVWLGDAILVMEREPTERLRDWRDAVHAQEGEWRPADATPQLLAIRADAFHQLGGYDESYVGYGFEDYDFARRAGERWPHRSVSGHIVHMWHEPDHEKTNHGPLYEANRQRWLAAGGEMWNE